MNFVFDPEIDDPDLDLFFEFVVAGTWERAFAVLDREAERSRSDQFWIAAADAVKRCDEPGLRHHLFGQAQIGLGHVTNDLPLDKREALLRQPKPRPGGDLDEAQRLNAMLREAGDAIDDAVERELVRGILAIDPCATVIWISAARLQPGGEQHPAHQRALNRYAFCVAGEHDLGIFAFEQGVQAVAKIYLGRCLRSLMGHENLFPNVAVGALSALGALHADLDETEIALDCLERARVIAEAATAMVGQESETTISNRQRLPAELAVRCQVNLAYMRMRAGRLDGAEALFAALLAERTQPSGEVDHIRARLLIGLGDVARRRGDTERATVLLVRGIELCGLRVTRDGRLATRLGEPWRPAADISFSKLSVQDYPSPRPDEIDPNGTWLIEAYGRLVPLIDHENSPDEESDASLDEQLLRVASAPQASTWRGEALSRLGTGYWRRAMHRQAEEALRAALDQYAATEAGWSSCADAEQMLATVQLDTGRYDDALVTIDRAIALFPRAFDVAQEVIERSLAQCHLLRSRILAKLGADRASVISHARTAAEYLKTNAFRPDDRLANVTIENAGFLLVALGLHDEGTELLLHASAQRVGGEVAYVDITTTPLGTLQRTGQCNGLWLVLQMIAEDKIEPAPYLWKIMRMLLDGRQASILASRRIARRSAAQDMTQQLRRDLQAIRERIQGAALAGHDSDDIEALTRNERDIMARLHAEIEADRGAPPPEDDLLLRLRDSLAEDEAHLEFICYHPMDLRFDTGFRVEELEPRTAALLCWQVSGALLMAFYDLGAEKELSELAGFLNRPYLFRESEPGYADREIAASMGWWFALEDDPHAVGILRTVYRERYDQTLGPVLHHLRDFRRWRLGVRGGLTAMSFDFLPVNNMFAAVQHEIVRDALFDAGGGESSAREGAAGAAVVIGAPLFDHLAPAPDLRHAGLRRHFLAGPFEGLPGAERESREIADLLGVEPVLGKEATRKRLLSIDNPSILHVATHGLFLKSEHREEAAEALRGSPLRTSKAGRLALARLIRDDPNSHIALALGSGGDEDEEAGFLHEGLVFGDEIALMNLVDTDLVTLSCCDSGAGLIHMVHGSINFPRAFLCAGAKAVVASLWPIADHLVQPLMTSFYRYILAGLPVGTALVRAKQDAESQGVPRLVWGAFQLFGRGDHVVHFRA